MTDVWGLPSLPMNPATPYETSRLQNNQAQGAVLLRAGHGEAMTNRLQAVTWTASDGDLLVQAQRLDGVTVYTTNTMHDMRRWLITNNYVRLHDTETQWELIP